MWQSNTRTSGDLGVIKRWFKCPLSFQVDEIIMSESITRSLLHIVLEAECTIFFYSLVLGMEIKPDGAGISWRVKSQEENHFSPLRVYNTQRGMKAVVKTATEGIVNFPPFLSCQRQQMPPKGVEKHGF